jgi:hypothetical protein
MNGAGGQGGNVSHNNVHVHIQSANPDSFRKSTGQMATEAMTMLGRMHARNG